MVIVPVQFPGQVEVKNSYMASEISKGVVVTVFGVTIIDAITRCLKAFNEKTHYDESYNV